MKTTNLQLPKSGLLRSLLPLLRGRVFHVTLLGTVDLILNSEEIRPNETGSFESPFGSGNGFFRNRNCVSLFDYRSATDEQLEESFIKCSPTLPVDHTSEPGLAIYLLSGERCPELLSWSRCKEENALREQVIPHVEAGHEGPIPLQLVDEILRIEVVRDPNSIAAMIRSAKERSEASD